MRVSVVGVGFVGGAVYKVFKEKGVNIVCYDKYKQTDTFTQCLESDIMFMCLPTLYDDNNNQYNTSAIHETCEQLNNFMYNGVVIIKSTVEPEFTLQLSNTYKRLKIIHNPEFLTARTALDDFRNQTHIVLGATDNLTNSDVMFVKTFYETHFPNAIISICSSTESESMKIFANSFYAVKIQFFNELYLTCQKNNANYNNILQLMLKNGWINEMHTTIPGHDGQLSYGGACFPKDTKALLSYMKKNEVACNVLNATIMERELMRDD
jgi:UDPglucose 6-dehydrogenase